MRLGLPLMVLTSLSIHVIVLLFWLLSERPQPGSGSDKTAAPPGPVVIISREITPEQPIRPPSHAPPPPPKPPTLADKSVPRPQPTPASGQQISAEAILSGRGGPHLIGGVVFLLDISGSMYEPYAGVTRLALARKFIDRQIAALPNNTPFAIALYGETTRSSGPLVAASNTTRAAAVQYLAQDYDCGGGTNLPAGLDVAEDLRPSSVILVTDGDLNIADAKLMQEARRILGQPGPQLSVFGIAPRDNTGDEQLLEDLVHQQAGSYQAMGVPGAK
jgi:hypothetical protein